MKRKLLPITALLVLGLVGCGENPPDNGGITQPTRPDVPKDESEPEGAAVAISNKEALTAKWFVDGTRDISITITPTRNALQELKQGHLTISCNDAAAFDITGLGLKAKKAGTFTITAKYWSKVDTVEVTVSELAPEPAKVTTTVANLLDNWGTMVATEKGTLFEIEAVITAWKDANATDGTKYGNFYIGDTVDATKTLYVYGCSANMKVEWNGSVPAYSYTQGDDAKDWLTNNMSKDAVIGGKVKIQVIAYTYSGTKELSGKLIAYTAPAVVDPETITLAKSEVTLEVGKSNSVKANLGPVGAVGTVEWSSSDATVATVDATGKITAVKAGQAIITAKVKDFATIAPATVKVNVVAADDSIALVGTPAVDTAYKLGIAQYNALFGNKDLYYFFNGKMNSYYLDMVNWANSVDVKLEQAGETAGNYYLYFNDPANENAKTYIEQYINGTYTNVKLTTTTPATVYTWDATNKTLVSKLGENTYGIGTSNTGTYATIGPRQIKSPIDSFYANLFTPVADKALKEIKCAAPGEIEVGATATLAPYASPVSAPLGTVSYSTGNAEIATVSDAGVITGVAAGETEITITSGEITKKVAIKVINDSTNYGTIEAPLTAAEALTIVEAQVKNNGDFTRKMVTVKGVMTAYEGYFNNGTKNNYVGKYTLNSGDKAILVNNSKATGEGIQGNVTIGDEIIVTGYITKDATLGIEFLKNADSVYPEIKAFGTRGQGSIAVDASSSDKATVTLPETATGTNGSEYTFKVVAADGYKVTAVKVKDSLNTVEVTGDDQGNYTHKFSGEQKIIVETAADNVTVYSIINSNANNGTWSTTSAKEFTNSEISFKCEGFKSGSGDAAEKNYGYWMINNGYIASMSCPDGVYVSQVEVKYTSGTGTSGKIVIEFFANPTAVKSTATGKAVTKGGSEIATNTDTTKKYFTVSNVAASNAQIAEIVISYTQIPA